MPRTAACQPVTPRPSSPAFRFSRPPVAGRKARKILRFWGGALLLWLLFLAAPFQAGAADVLVNGTDKSALNDAVTTATDGDTIIWSNTGSTTFVNTDTAVEITNTGHSRVGITLKGAKASGFSTSVADLAAKLLAGADARKYGPTADLNTWVQTQINSFNSDLSFTGLTTINGASKIRETDAQAQFNSDKLLNIQANRLGLTNLYFTDATRAYTFYNNPNGGGVVNGLIGSPNGNAAAITMGDLSGNAFSDLDVTLHGYRDTHYLAGGGIVGLRSTGNSASMGNIDGNIFRNLTVITDMDTAGLQIPPPTGSAYIEGGGIIGVDAVSSPASYDGDAVIAMLTNNFFTNIGIVSDDIILGGGLVGVNNNTRKQYKDKNDPSDPDVPNNALLDTVSGNVFGNGVFNNDGTGNINVHSYYSLRGGGVIGVNGLSNATVTLQELKDNVFAGITVESEVSYIKGGGIVGLQSNDGGKRDHDGGGSAIDPGSESTIDSMATYLDTASGNLFLSARVNAATFLDGGGVIGLRANTGTTGLSNLSNNIFKDLTVTVATTTVNIDNNYLYGGGVVGLSSANWALMNVAKNNYFDNIRLYVGDSDTLANLHGGGVIGVNTEDLTANADILTLSDNIFKDIGVNVTNQLSGGGVVGGHARAGTAGTAATMLITRNIFDGLTVEAGSLSGGGGVGMDAGSGDAVLGYLVGNHFIGETVITVSDFIDGGGLVGARADTAGTAQIDYLTDSTFQGVTVTSGGNLTGGGLIGVKSDHNMAYIGEIIGNTFSSSTVTVNNGSNLTGGGLIGVKSDLAALVTEISGNVFTGRGNFMQPDINVTGSIDGGGVIGVQANDVGARIISLTGNDFLNVTVQSGGDLTGGGLIGIKSESEALVNEISGNVFTGRGNFMQPDINVTGSIDGGGVIGVQANDVGATIELLTGNEFWNVVVHSGEYLAGGGLIGVKSESYAYIDEISGQFINSHVTSDTYIDGGGIIGVTSPINDVGHNITAGIGRIANSSFINNTITADNGQIMGGLVYSYGLAGGLEITDSSFFDNHFYSNLTPVDYTGAATAQVYGAVTVDTGVAPSNTDTEHTLTLTASGPNKGVFFGYNTVSLDGALATPSNSLYFGKVLNLTGLSSIQLEATEDPVAADARLIINAQTGGTVSLLDPISVDQTASGAGIFTFNMDVQGSGGRFFWGGDNQFLVDVTTETTTNGRLVDLQTGSDTSLRPFFNLTAVNHDFDLKTGASMVVTNNNSMALAQANLNGTLVFDISLIPVNSEPNSMLTITTDGDSLANVIGATVKLSDLPINSPLLGPGDKFYLIKTQDSDGLVSGDDHLLGADNDLANDHFLVHQGQTHAYNFIIDGEGVGGEGDHNQQYLVARLAVGPLVPIVPHEARIFLEGRAAGMAWLGQRGSWLADHSYQSADLALDQTRGERAWAPFGGVDFARMRADTGGRVDISGVNMLVGLAGRQPGSYGSLLLAPFLEAGLADYDTFNDFAGQSGIIRGDGSLNYLGGGLLGRWTSNSRFRIEGSVRAGRLKTDFHSADYTDFDGTHAAYDFSSNYFAAHAGLGRTWQVNEDDDLDLLARYYWTRQKADRAILSTGEILDFESNDSHRLRLGGRYTHKDAKARLWYAGAAYEHEFDNRPIALNEGGGVISGASLRGGTGIGEIGLIIRSRPDSPLSLEAGLQGYVGRLEGFSGGIRIGYEF